MHSGKLRRTPAEGLYKSYSYTKEIFQGSSLRGRVVKTRISESIDAGMTQVENMKAYLGPKYKQLKLLTRNFASNEIHAESYVDQVLCLFDDGINDEMFWVFLPNVIQSCPNEQNSRKAQQYLDSLRSAYGFK